MARGRVLTRPFEHLETGNICGEHQLSEWRGIDGENTATKIAENCTRRERG
jgi:hypothetical protein